MYEITKWIELQRSQILAMFIRQKPKGTKGRRDKCNYIKLKRFYTAKKIIDKIKKWFIQQEKIFTNYPSNNELIFKIHWD